MTSEDRKVGHKLEFLLATHEVSVELEAALENAIDIAKGAKQCES